MRPTRLWHWLVAVVLYRIRGREPDPERHLPPGVPSPEEHERQFGHSDAAAWTVVGAFLVAAAAAAGYIVFYVAFPDTQLLGLCLGLAFAAMAVAFVVLGKEVFPREEAEEERHDFVDEKGDEETRAEIEGILSRGFQGVSRRKAIALAGGAATATIGAAVLFPVASLGPSVGARIRETPWTRGRRVVDEHGRPFRPDDVPIGTFRLAFPEGAIPDSLGAPINLVRLPLDEIEMPDEAKRFMPDGVMAYSRICPHAGCAVSIYRHPKYEPAQQPRPALVCPCHFSTFDVRKGGELVFGPAGRDLPSLPLALNAAGELIAARGFTERIGPSWGGVRKGPDDQPLKQGEG